MNDRPVRQETAWFRILGKEVTKAEGVWLICTAFCTETARGCDPVLNHAYSPRWRAVQTLNRTGELSRL